MSTVGMEDPKTFSAPVTALNDNSASTDREPISSGQDVKHNSDLPSDDIDTKRETDPSKNEDATQAVKSDTGADKKPDSNGYNKSLEDYQDSTEHKDDSNSSDKIQSATKETDLEANVSGSSQTSDVNEKKEDQARDPNIVDWDGPDDPQNPMNWPAWKVKLHIFLVSSITFIRCVRYSTSLRLTTFDH